MIWSIQRQKVEKTLRHHVQSLYRSCKDEWKEKVGVIGNFEAHTQSDQHKKFKWPIQEFNKEYLADNTLKTQKKAMRDGKLHYNGHEHHKVVKRLFVVDKCFELFSPQATSFSIFEMTEEVMPNTLRPEACLDFILQGRNKLMKKKDIIDMVTEISNFLSLKHNIKQKKKSHSSNYNPNCCYRSHGSNGNSGNQPCHKHHGAHTWKDCPLKKHGKNHKLSGEVNSMEEQPWVWYQDPNKFKHFPTV